MQGGGPDRQDRGFALCEGATQARLSRAGPPAEGLERGVGQGGVRLDPQMLVQKLAVDRPAGTGTDEQGQAFDLLAHQTPLTRQAGHETIEGVGCQTHLVGRQGLAGHAGDVAGLVFIADDADGAGLLLGGLAQGGVTAQLVGLDHQHGVGIIAALGMGLDGGGHRLVHPGLQRRQPNSHQTAPAHQGHGRQGLFQPAFVAVDVAVGQDGDIERVVQVRGDRPAQDLGPFGDARPILAVDHRRPDRRIGRLQKAVDLGAFGQNHRFDRACIRSSRIRRASSAAARSSPSCWAAMAA